MLPIDEHAKSGAWVYCTNGTRQELKKVRWQGGSWVSASGFGGAPEEAYSYYLPASWVENAAKMREALTFMVTTFDAGMLPSKNILDDARKVLAAVKRSPNQEPEPSEAERVERVAKFLCDEFALGYGWDDAGDLCRAEWRKKARAALKAMEGE